MTPSDRTTKPVPTAFPAWPPPKIESTPWVRVVTLTTAGSTRCTTETIGSLPGWYAFPFARGRDGTDALTGGPVGVAVAARFPEHAVRTRTAAASVATGRRSAALRTVERSLMAPILPRLPRSSRVSTLSGPLWPSLASYGRRRPADRHSAFGTCWVRIAVL